jgi:hypothetical protein
MMENTPSTTPFPGEIPTDDHVLDLEPVTHATSGPLGEDLDKVCVVIYDRGFRGDEELRDDNTAPAAMVSLILREAEIDLLVKVLKQARAQLHEQRGFRKMLGGPDTPTDRT